MDADDDNDARIACFDLGEIGECMNAIDAAKRPKIEQDDSAFEVREVDRLLGVQPIGAADEIGSVDPFRSLHRGGMRGWRFETTGEKTDSASQKQDGSNGDGLKNEGTHGVLPC